jgi:carbonic anhydrase
VTATDGLVANAETYVARHGHDGDRSNRPALQVTIVSCMDSRIDLFAVFGLKVGDAHMIRNAGGLVTDDTVRSLAISQRFLGTKEILLVHHTNCGLEGMDDAKLADDMERETGERPTWRAGGFTDPAESVRASMERVRTDPFIAVKDSVRGFVFDVKTGALTEVV